MTCDGALVWIDANAAPSDVFPIVVAYASETSDEVVGTVDMDESSVDQSPKVAAVTAPSSTIPGGS